jgi:hypothetical protein
MKVGFPMALQCGAVAAFLPKREVYLWQQPIKSLD